MYKTIIMIIGVLFAMLFFGIAIRQVIENLNNDEVFEITSLATRAEADSVLVQWETSIDASGTVIYTVNGTTLTERETGFSKIHGVQIRNLQGTVQYHAESCSPKGICMQTEMMNGTFYARHCSDETLWGSCSLFIPRKCIEGSLIDMCRDCGCPVGLACVSNGSCVNRT